MKLFSWAHKKLLPSTAPCVNHQHNADDLFGVSRSNLTCAGEQGLQATASRSAHGEVLTIGTLGMGNLLSREEGEEGEEEEVEADDDDEEEEEEEEEEEKAHVLRCMAYLASPNRQSMSSNRASTSSNYASTSSNRASVSSNRESVSSVDIQKLQDELQKILYFKLGQGHEEGGGKKSKAALKAKGKKQKKRRQLTTSNEKSHVPSERGSMRGALPLHHFLEMPMDPISYKSTTKPPSKFLNNTQYLLLMQSLKSKFLHYTSPTRVNFSTSLLERLVKPTINKDLQHGSTMDKMLQLLRKIMNKRPYRRSDNGHEKYKCERDEEKCLRKEEVKEEEEEDVLVEEERLKWALAKSFRGSDRFINYIASIMEHTERNTKCFVNEEYFCHYPYQLSWEKGSRLQLMPSTSPSLENECWIKTDDEYFVLEL